MMSQRRAYTDIAVVMRTVNIFGLFTQEFQTGYFGKLFGHDDLLSKRPRQHHRTEKKHRTGVHDQTFLIRQKVGSTLPAGEEASFNANTDHHTHENLLSS